MYDQMALLFNISGVSVRRLSEVTWKPYWDIQQEDGARK